MIRYQHDLSLDHLVHAGPDVQRTLLSIYTGDDLSKVEAGRMWQRITDHKWYVSEHLGRDIGFHVAAVDYVENFYRANSSRTPSTKTASIALKIWHRFNKVLRSYFTAKGGVISY